MPVLVAAPELVRLPYSGRYVTIGEVTLSTGQGSTDAYGVTWVLEKVAGWDGPTAGSGSVTARSGDDGGWPTPAFRSPRTVTVEGSVGADWETANAAIRRLVSAVPVSALGLAIFGGAGPEMQAMVRQGGDMMVDGNQSVTRFSLALVAPDPRRYSTELLTAQTGLAVRTGGMTLNGVGLSLPLSVAATAVSGALSATNEGNMATRPLLTVRGPAQSVSITHVNTGKVLTCASPIPAGSSLMIDTDQRTALLDGTALRVMSGTWFEYAPGVNQLAFTAPTYDPATTLISAHRSAWQ